MRRDYDCIVVGAGPGGSTAAYELTRQGVRVGLFEKQSLPRTKPCAGCLSLKMVTTYGMSDAVGLLTYDQPTSPFLPGAVPAPSRAHSEDTARTIDHEVRTIVDQAHEQVRQILGENKDALERLARRLLDQEVLEGAELQDLLAPQPVTTVAAFSPREPHRES